MKRSGEQDKDLTSNEKSTNEPPPPPNYKSHSKLEVNVCVAKLANEDA